MHMKMSILKTDVLFLLLRFASYCLVKEIGKTSSQLVNCSIQCIASSACHSFLYDKVNWICHLQNDQPTVKGFQKYYLVQFQNLGHKLLQYRASDNKTQVSRGNCQIDETISSLKRPGCDLARTESFHEACRVGKLVKVKRLVCSGLVDVDCRNATGSTALMLAAWHKQENIVHFLVQQKADLSASDFKSDTVLHYACSGGDLGIVKTLLNNRRIDMESRNTNGETPLIRAVIGGKVSVVSFLKDNGADLKTLDGFENNILHAACGGGHVDMVKYILSLNITDIESKGAEYRTPLLTAVSAGHVSVVKMLKDKGADMKAEDEQNDNILHIACLYDRLEMLAYILSLKIINLERKEISAGYTPVLIAIGRGNTSFVQLLMDNGAKLTDVDDENNNILHLACELSNVDMVTFVLKQQVVHIDIESKTSIGQTPVMKAVVGDKIEVVKLLHDTYHVNLAAKDEDDNNVFHLACQDGHLHVVQYLVTLKELKGFERKKNRDGQTPVDLAEEGSYADTVAFMLKHAKMEMMI